MVPPEPTNPGNASSQIPRGSAGGPCAFPANCVVRSARVAHLPGRRRRAVPCATTSRAEPLQRLRRLPGTQRAHSDAGKTRRDGSVAAEDLGDTLDDHEYSVSLQGSSDSTQCTRYRLQTPDMDILPFYFVHSRAGGA
ncbi:hypothetical protein BDW22DRAFT_490382 [Trametopsis cervina]|nr:hypothetical protein BDW22DRAFT_490382 [Trametopsis cervina]